MELYSGLRAANNYIVPNELSSPNSDILYFIIAKQKLSFISDMTMYT